MACFSVRQNPSSERISLFPAPGRGSITYYVTSQSDWIYGAADFYVVPNIYQTSLWDTNVCLWGDQLCV